MRTATKPPRHLCTIPAPRTAFTLVELLVVIGISITLAALVPTAVSSVRTLSGSQRCLAAQKQLFAGLLTYASEQDNRLVDGWIAPHTRWPDSIASYVEPAFRLGTGPSTYDAANPYQSCIGFDPRMQGYGWALNTMPNHGNPTGADLHNCWFPNSTGTAAATWTTFTLALIHRPATRVYLSDAWSSRYALGSPGSWYNPVTGPGAVPWSASDWDYAVRHQQRMNAVFFDGRGSSLLRKDLPAAFSGFAR